MKSLTKYLNEKLIIFPSQVDEKSGIFPSQVDEKLVVNHRFDEKLIINKDYKNAYTCAPTSWEELRKIIEDRYNKLGSGTKDNQIDFNDVDVSNIDSFYDEDNDKGIFEGTKFEYIDISDWDVSNIKDMCYMFYGCDQLKSVGDLSKWNVSKVTCMNSMFYSCEKLISIGDLSNWNVSNVERMDEMFDNSGITNIPTWYKE